MPPTRRRTLSEPCDLTAVEARTLIGRRALSPVELLNSCLARIAAVDHAVNAMVALDADRALLAAQAAEAAVMRGDDLPPLHGLPIGVKDLEDTAGLRTTYGSPLFRDHIPTADDRSVASVRRAGAIVLGKTNTPEWGAGANTRNAVYGATGNPFDPSRSAAGSSGGSAVALACGMVPLATGSDMGGSLRTPAAFCGVVGFRPSPGVVPSEKHLHGWSPLSVNGPMGRTVADAALLLSAMAGSDMRDPLCAPPGGPPFPTRPARIDLSRLRVAFTVDFGEAPVSRAVAETFREKIKPLQHAAACLDESTPDCRGTDAAFAVLRGVVMIAAHAERVQAHPDQVGPNVRTNVTEGMSFGAADVARALTLQTVLYQRWQAFFEHFDVLLAPAAAITPRPWRELYPAEIDGTPTRSYYHWLELAYAVSIVGHPSLCLPAGRDAGGMPFGIQVIGPRGGDARVLSVAAELEQVFAGDVSTRRPVPDLALLRAAPRLADAPGFLGFG